MTVSVTDGVNESVTEIKRVPINLQNAAPVIQKIVVIERVHAVSSVELEAEVHDADGDTLTYSWEVEKGFPRFRCDLYTDMDCSRHDGCSECTVDGG